MTNKEFALKMLSTFEHPFPIVHYGGHWLFDKIFEKQPKYNIGEYVDFHIPEGKDFGPTEEAFSKEYEFEKFDYGMVFSSSRRSVVRLKITKIL